MLILALPDCVKDDLVECVRELNAGERERLCESCSAAIAAAMSPPLVI